MKKREKNLKEKSSIIASCISACIVMLIIVTIVVCVSNRKNVGIASKDEQELPKAITVIGSTPNPNSGIFQYETSSDPTPIQVPVPTGYVGSTDPEERYVNGVTTEGVREHHGGFVIYEKKAGETDEQARVAMADIDTARTTRNQWVWVPVPKTESAEGGMYYTSNSGILYANYYNYTFTGNGGKMPRNTYEPNLCTFDKEELYLCTYMNGKTRTSFLQEMREDFAAMIESVQTYGGFYIGRYETGNLNKSKPVIVKNNSDIANVCWYKMYKLCKYLRGNNPVYTGLIYSIQWDETLKWLEASGEKSFEEIKNPSNWGNVVGNPERTGQQYASGYSETWKANNIYDQVGNVNEFTMMYYSSNCRICRGGHIYTSGQQSPLGMLTSEKPNVKYTTLGCRAQLYISSPATNGGN